MTGGLEKVVGVCNFYFVTSIKQKSLEGKVCYKRKRVVPSTHVLFVLIDPKDNVS